MRLLRHPRCRHRLAARTAADAPAGVVRADGNGWSSTVVRVPVPGRTPPLRLRTSTSTTVPVCSYTSRLPSADPPPIGRDRLTLGTRHRRGGTRCHRRQRRPGRSAVTVADVTGVGTSLSASDPTSIRPTWCGARSRRPSTRRTSASPTSTPCTWAPCSVLRASLSDSSTRWGWSACRSSQWRTMHEQDPALREAAESVRLDRSGACSRSGWRR